ncbi:MAG: MerR family transcriptional regulator [Nitrospirota bacterium]
MKNTRDKKQPVYMISVVSRMLGVHPQTLRLYEREGLISPHREKRSRLYSQEDVERIALILRLTRELGVNRSAVEIILRLRHRVEVLQNEIEEMMNYLEEDIRKDFIEKIRKVFLED